MANAVYYNVNGTPTKDKFYAYCTDKKNGIPAAGYIFLSDSNSTTGGNLTWGKSGTTQGTTADTIGSGKMNTAKCLTALGTTSGTIWYYLKNTLNTANKNECNDWFIGSTKEYEELIKSGLPGAYVLTVNAYDVWTSVEYNGTRAYLWYCDSREWVSNYSKDTNAHVLPIRAF